LSRGGFSSEIIYGPVDNHVWYCFKSEVQIECVRSIPERSRSRERDDRFQESDTEMRGNGASGESDGLSRRVRGARRVTRGGG
jgi:hypothetical protein